jgi:hypothetical protein
MANDKIFSDKKGNTWVKIRGQYTKIKDKKVFITNFYEPNVLYYKKI